MAANGDILPDAAQERIEPEDGDERKVGRITVAVDIAQAIPVQPVPAPPDHPARSDLRELLVARPPSRLVMPPPGFDPRRTRT
jgi:hypothetical protein